MRKKVKLENESLCGNNMSKFGNHFPFRSRYKFKLTPGPPVFWPQVITLLEIKSVFQDKGPGKHVKVLFTWETDRNSRLFSRQMGPLHVCHSLYPRKHTLFPAVL